MNRNSKPKFEDRKIGCLDCGIDFLFEAGEQLYFWSKNLADPKRCPACRANRRATLVTRKDINEVRHAN